VQVPFTRYISWCSTTVSWCADPTGVFPLCAIISIAPITSVSVAPNRLDRHPVLLSSHFPSSEQCYIPKGRSFEYNSVVPIYSCTRSSYEGELRLIPNPLRRVSVALTFMCAGWFTCVPFRCTQLPVAFTFQLNTYPTGVILLCTVVLLHFSGVWYIQRVIIHLLVLPFSLAYIATVVSQALAATVLYFERENTPHPRLCKLHSFWSHPYVHFNGAQTISVASGV